MAKRVARLLPPLERRLARLGGRLHVARLRRRLSAKLAAERAGMSVMTLRGVERGGMGVYDPSVHGRAILLGLDDDVDTVAERDTLGRELQDAALPRRIRAAKSAPRSTA